MCLNIQVDLLSQRNGKYHIMITSIYNIIRSARSSLLRQLEQMYTNPKTGGGKKTSASRVSMVPNRSRLSQISNASSLLSSDLLPPSGQGEEDMELYIKIEGALANEVGLTVLETLEVFGEHFKVQTDI